VALTPGTRIGSYEITAQIGVGGMGEVYRATDTNLARQVAIKVLPEAVAADAERLARFDREAKTLAVLNHPNIAAIYGLERSAGTTALVMELVEGPTLADRIAQGPIPVDEALAIAKQIAEALEAAHEQGIIHRDLKPANVKVRQDGTVKVLDFGLAKAMEPTGAMSPAGSMSPTITTPAITQAGLILGTAAYMSPEQARGKPVDRRADIWAFGCVLYEMLAGTRAFEDEDVSTTLSKVLQRDPDFEALPATVPPAVRQTLRTCLRKDARQRASDIHDVRLAMEGAFNAEADASQAAAVEPPRLWQRPRVAGALLAGAVVLALVVGAVASWLVTPAPAPLDVMRFVIAPPAQAPLLNSPNLRDLAITRDGRQVIYVGRGPDGPALYSRAVDQLEGAPIRGADLARSPFVSPDGQWVGFLDVSQRRLQKVSILGGPPLLLYEVSSGAIIDPRWMADGHIIFGEVLGPDAGLSRVGESGGEIERLTEPDAGERHLWPFALPGGKTVLFTAVTLAGGGGQATRWSQATAQLMVLTLDTGEIKTLDLAGTSPHYVRTGHLLYATADNTLRAVPFDADRLEVTGSPVPVVEALPVGDSGAADFDASDDGRLVYVSGTATAETPRLLVWVDREGHEEAIEAPPRPYFSPKISPDGTRIAVEVRDDNTDIWVQDLRRGTQSRLTFDPAVDRFPLWTPDGERIAFSSAREATRYSAFWKEASGTGQVERIGTDPDRRLDVWSWTPDGRTLLLNEAGNDIGFVTLDGDGMRQPLLDDPGYSEGTPEISPDGRWMAYRSNESGQFQIYVRPYPDVTGGKWQVSTAGGQYPGWSRDGRELFYRSLDGAALMGVTVDDTATAFSASIPRVVLETPYVYSRGDGRNWDVTADGKRFLFLKDAVRSTDEAEAPEETITVVLNWFEELKRLVPTN